MGVYDYITETGTIVPDTAEIQTEVEEEFRAVFGDDFVVDPETPEGGLITAEVTSRQSVARNNSRLANQINPNLSGGTFFDSIWALTGGGRDLASSSTVQLSCTGVAGTVITAGSRAADANGNNWLAATDITIAANGQVTGSFNSENTGPITASLNTINVIVDNSVLGWETVNNEASATPGINTQSDVSGRRERADQLALQGRSTAIAVTSNLLNTTGVRSFSFRENISNTTEVIDGITLVAHSIWAAVDGGTDEDIASSLLEAKSGGAGWNGAVSTPTLEAASGQTFNVLFDRPIAVPVRIRLTLRSGLGVNPSEQVIDSIVNYSNGISPVGRGFVTGNDVSPFEISAAVNNDMPGAFVQGLEIALDTASPTFTQATLPIALNQIAAIQSANIEVILL